MLFDSRANHETIPSRRIGSSSVFIQLRSGGTARMTMMTSGTTYNRTYGRDETSTVNTVDGTKLLLAALPEASMK